MTTLIAGLAMVGIAKADPLATHGMLLFGESAQYASHLPMFHAPHDRQLILKVALKPGPVLQAYAAAKAAGKTLFTLLPEPLDLSLLAQGATKGFSADLFDGHFERGGVDLGPIEVSVEKVVLSAKLHPEAPASASYLVFGGNGEYFAAHLIGGKPSFDAIAKTGAPYHLFTPHCRSRVCADPIRTPIADSALPITLGGPGDASSLPGAALGALVGGAADVSGVIYSESGDLSE